MNEIPRNEAELEEILRTAERLKDSADFQSALEVCQQLLDEPATCLAGLRARADIYADMREKNLELADRESLVNLGSEEPSDHYELGIGLWRSGRFPEAATAFSEAITLGNKEGFDYYTNSSRMHLVALLIKLGRYDEASREGSLIPDNYSSYLPSGMMTKEHLMEILN
ncbi:hypothetical protein ACSAM1_10445 [Xanthomonas citri pv. bilvae]|uniref:hypothetical protein n=1 Tax=Xanthomonas citri TaxID=346 RepID=UPI0005428C0B|nr:hypothetical protein XAB3213_5150002 [Xanthomonas citri pv. bilvae]